MLSERNHGWPCVQLNQTVEHYGLDKKEVFVQFWILISLAYSVSMFTFIWPYKITTHYKIIFDTMCAMSVVLHSRFLLHIFMLNTLLLFSETMEKSSSLKYWRKNLTWIIYPFNDYSPVTQQFHNSFYDL